jgi:hypothetical protein
LQRRRLDTRRYGLIERCDFWRKFWRILFARRGGFFGVRQGRLCQRPHWGHFHGKSSDVFRLRRMVILYRNVNTGLERSTCRLPSMCDSRRDLFLYWCGGLLSGGLISVLQRGTRGVIDRRSGWNLLLWYGHDHSGARSSGVDYCSCRDRFSRRCSEDFMLVRQNRFVEGTP